LEMYKVAKALGRKKQSSLDPKSSTSFSKFGSGLRQSSDPNNQNFTMVIAPGRHCFQRIKDDIRGYPT